jgi:nitroreductase
MVKIISVPDPRNMPAPHDSPSRATVAPGRRTLTIMDAIYGRRAVRRFNDTKVPEAAIHALLYAAVQAPTLAQDTTVLGFSVICDRQILHDLSDWTGRLYNAVEGETPRPHGPDMKETGFSLFHNAGTLIILYAMSDDERHLPECWMAAENLMLAACGMGLGTCLITPVIDALNSREWKQRLEVPLATRAVTAIVIGTTAGTLPSVNRFPPEVFSWVS